MKFPLTIQAIVTDGSPALSEYQRDRMQRFYAAREGKPVQLTIRDHGKPRSLNQNSYYHGVVVSMIADETGHEPDEVHAYLRTRFLPRKLIELGDDALMVATSTTQLSSGEFEEYLERIRAFAATELNMEIPMPHESL